MTLPRVSAAALSRNQNLSEHQRRLLAMGLAATVCVALAVASITLDGHAADGAGFLFFVLSLPWTISVYLVTMVVGFTSPAAILVALAVPTALIWRVLSTQLIKRAA